MKFYKAVPRKDFVKAITEINEQKNVEKRQLFLRLSLIIKEVDFAPVNFVINSFYAGDDKDTAQEILKIPQEQNRFYKKLAEKVFSEVEKDTTESGLYSIVPFNFIDEEYLKLLIQLFSDKKYKNIYLVTEYKKPDLNLSLNTSLDYGNFDYLKKKEDNLYKENSRLSIENESLNKKLLELQEYLSKTEVEYKHNIEQIQKEVSDQKNLVNQKQTQITKLTQDLNTSNTQKQNFQNQVNTLNTQLTQVNNQKNTLQTQVNQLTNQRNALQNQVTQLQGQVGGNVNVRVQRVNGQPPTLGTIMNNYFEVEGYRVSFQSAMNLSVG